MFTLNQVNDIHGLLGKQVTLPEYLRALKDSGVAKYDSFVSDRHSEYYATNDQKLASPPVHETFAIANTIKKEQMLTCLRSHEEGKIDYFDMSKGLADSEIEKWTFDTINMTLTHYGSDGSKVW